MPRGPDLSALVRPASGLTTLQVFANHSEVPEAQGLFNPENDKDACGVGFVAELSKEPTRQTVTEALEMLVRMAHRGACGCEANTGGGAAWTAPPVGGAFGTRGGVWDAG